MAWQRLGHGEFNEAWLAWSSCLWAPVTVKICRAAGRKLALGRAYLRDEAELLAQLAHPSLQRLLSIRVDDLPPHVVLEYVEGPSLAAVLLEQQFSAADARMVTLQLLSALHYLHGQGMAHLDLSPSNVLLREGRIVLLDLELARPLGHVRSSGPPNGTEGYQAPEYVAGDPVTPGMDIFAVGAICFELLTGEPASCAATGTLRSREEIRALLARTSPSGLAGAIANLLEPDPASRPESAAAALTMVSQTMTDQPLWPDFVPGP
ncbi:MAG: serine/threonine-protein kinase [Tetrasphaera sp.]